MTTELLERAYRDVLVPSFPVDELTLLPDLTESYAGAAPEPATVVVDEKGEPVAAMLLEVFPRSGVLLLSYLAARADRRSRGVGRLLLTEHLARWRRAVRPAVVLAEIEDPRHHGVTRFGDPSARLRFYDRLGAGLLPLRYFQPSLRPGLSRVDGMFLIVLPGDGGEAPSWVDTATLEAFLEEYFVSCEGKASAAEPRFVEVLAALRQNGSRTPVVRPLSEYAESVPSPSPREAG